MWQKLKKPFGGKSLSFNGSKWVINTKFFHKIVNANRRYGMIDKLKVNGELKEDQEVIKRETILL